MAGPEPSPIPVRPALPMGNAVRLPGLRGLHLVLVVGDDDASRFWFHAAAHTGHPLLSHFITEEDVRALQPVLAVQPERIPAVLVCQDGWVIDWFAAPPAPGGPLGKARFLDPTPFVLGLLRSHVPAYAPA